MRQTKPYKSLRDKMTPEQRQASETKKNLALIQLTLQELRKERNLTQAQLAASLDVVQSALSKLENQDDILVSTLSRYVAAMGGHLVITAEFPDKKVCLSQFSSHYRAS
jgi:transcriptional regulator with XRE-family HTH domain